MNGIICISDAVNWAHPLNRGLVSRYVALPDQQRGVVFRDLCRRFDGTIVSGMAWEGAHGRPGGWGCLNCAGAGNYVNVGDRALGTGTAYTLTAWVRASVSADEIFFGRDKPTGATPRMWQLRFDAAGTIRFIRFNTSNASIGSPVSSGVWDDNIWHRVAATTGPLGGTLYVDGKLEGSNVNVATHQDGTGTTAAIGAASSNEPTQTPYNGLIDDVRIIAGRAWSAADAAADFLDCIQGCPGTLNWMRRGRYVTLADGTIVSSRYYYQHLLAGGGAA